MQSFSAITRSDCQNSEAFECDNNDFIRIEFVRSLRWIITNSTDCSIFQKPEATDQMKAGAMAPVVLRQSTEHWPSVTRTMIPNNEEHQITGNQFGKRELKNHW